MPRRTATRKGIAFLIACLCLLASLFTHPLYEDVDNYSVSMVTMGLFGGNGCQYTHVALNLLLGGLSRVLPAADAFALLGRALVFLCFYLLLTMASDGEGMIRFLSCALFCLFFSISLPLFTANYGIQAVFFAGTGWLALSRGIRGGRRSLSACGFLLLLTGMLWRLSVAAVLLPYILLDLAFRLPGSSGAERRRAVRGLLPVCLAALLLAGCQALYERSPAARDGFAYDRARILLEDYPTKEWDEIEETGEELGFTELDYDMARLWFLADTERMDAAFLTRMGEAGKTVQYGLNPEGLSGAANELVHFFEDERKENYAWVAGMLLLVFLTALTGAPARYSVQAVLAAAGSLAVILFFLMIGRAPLRLLHMVFTAETLSLSGILVRAEEAGKTGRRGFTAFRAGRLALCLLLLFSAGYTLRKDGIRAPQTAFLARAERDGEEEETDFTLWEDWHAGVAHALMDEGRLPSARTLSRNLPAGDWAYGQLYFTEYLNRIGKGNPARFLLQNDGAYFATNDGEFLREMLSYLAEKTGKRVVAAPSGEKNGIARYALRYALAKEEELR